MPLTWLCKATGKLLSQSRGIEARRNLSSEHQSDDRNAASNTVISLPNWVSNLSDTLARNVQMPLNKSARPGPLQKNESQKFYIYLQNEESILSGRKRSAFFAPISIQRNTRASTVFFAGPSSLTIATRRASHQRLAAATYKRPPLCLQDL